MEVVSNQITITAKITNLWTKKQNLKTLEATQGCCVWGICGPSLSYIWFTIYTITPVYTLWWHMTYDDIVYLNIDHIFEYIFDTQQKLLYDLEAVNPCITEQISALNFLWVKLNLIKNFCPVAMMILRCDLQYVYQRTCQEQLSCSTCKFLNKRYTIVLYIKSQPCGKTHPGVTDTRVCFAVGLT